MDTPDIYTAIIHLCDTHIALRRCQPQETSGPARGLFPPPVAPLQKALDVLEGEIGRLLPLLPEEARSGLLGPVARTHAPALAALIPRPAREAGYTSSTANVLFAIRSGPEALRLELDLGMRPDLAEFDDVFLALMDFCARPEALTWRQEARRLISRQSTALFTTVLWYVRDQHNQGNPIAPPLSVFLADLLRDRVTSHPEEASQVCQSARIGSSTHDMAAMIIAGAAPPPEDGILPQGGPKVRALLDACASSHGRLDLIRRFGPLERYFERGEVPDFRPAC